MLSRYWISSDTPLGSLAKNKLPEHLRLLCRNIVGETSFARVSLPNIRDVGGAFVPYGIPGPRALVPSFYRERQYPNLAWWFV